MHDRTGRAFALGVTTTLGLAAACCRLALAAGAAWPGRGAVPVGQGLTFLALGAAALVTAWATVLLASASLALVPARPSPGRGLPPGLRGRVVVGLLVVAGLGAAPAAAQEVPSATVVARLHPGAPDAPAAPAPPGATPEDDAPPVPGWTPTVRPAPPGRAAGEVGLVSTTGAEGDAGTRAAHEVVEVVVHRGDTLWAIAARSLGDAATDQDVAEAWPRWYAANRDVIGDDPDLILPGQRLLAPAPGSTR